MQNWPRVLWWAVAVVPLLASAPAAQEIKNMMGKAPTTQELIRALTPPANKPEVKYRGLKLMPEATPEEKEAMPGVALNVNFKFNSAELTPEAKQVLLQVATAMQSPSLQRYHFQLEGHTDSKGSEAYNLGLSRRRAQAVYDYLTGMQKVARDRLDVVGRGAASPLDPAHPESGVNRRVQIINVGS